MFVLIMPRSTEPTDVPLPMVDRRVIDRIERDDAARATQAKNVQLPTDVRALGSAVRAFHAAQANADPVALEEARHALNDAAQSLATRPNAIQDILALRALMAQEFLGALETYEKDGAETKDLAELGGLGFLRGAKIGGWIRGKAIDIDASTRRVMFKVVWNGVSGFDRAPELALNLDEERVLYSLYIAHPHAAEPDRLGLDAQRHSATTPEACETASAAERRSTELWRIEKVKKLAAVDPTYPGSYAVGVGFYRAGRYEQSIEAFRIWLDRHPDGALGVRARNHLKAAVAKANGS